MGLVHSGVSEYWAIVRGCQRAALPSDWDGRIGLAALPQFARTGRATEP